MRKKNELSSRLVDLLQTNPKCGRLKLCKLDGCRLLEQRLTLRVLRQQLAITVLLCKVASNCTALEELETIIVLLQMGHLSVNSSARKINTHERRDLSERLPVLEILLGLGLAAHEIDGYELVCYAKLPQHCYNALCAASSCLSLLSC